MSKNSIVFKKIIISPSSNQNEEEIVDKLFVSVAAGNKNSIANILKEYPHLVNASKNNTTLLWSAVSIGSKK